MELSIINLLLVLLAAWVGGLITAVLAPLFMKWGTGWLRRRGEFVRSWDQRNGVLIIGASAAARALGRILARSQPLWILDRNRELCALAEADGLNVICGNALDEEVLSEAQAARVRTLIALTPNTEVNTLVAQAARTTFYVPEVHVLNRGDGTGHSALLEHLNATTIFGGPAKLVDWDYRIDHDEAERNGLNLEHSMTPQELFEKLQDHRETLPFAIRRGDRYLPFHSGFVLQPYDRVILLQETDARTVPFDRFDHLAVDCPVLDIGHGISTSAFFELAAASLAPRLRLESTELASMLHDRERTSSTVLVPGISIPHVVVDGHDVFEMALVRCREGIHFSDQPERIHTAFVLVSSQDERNFHLRAISAIAQILQWPDFEQSWLMAPDAKALRRLVLRGSRRRLPERPDPPSPEESTLIASS